MHVAIWQMRQIHTRYVNHLFYRHSNAKVLVIRQNPVFTRVRYWVLFVLMRIKHCPFAVVVLEIVILLFGCVFHASFYFFNFYLIYYSLFLLQTS